MEIKPEHHWLQAELYSISRIDGIGEFSRRMWYDAKGRPDFKAFWNDLPLWFRQEAREILGGKFTPKPKPTRTTHSDLIMEAIKDAVKELDNPSE